MMRELFILCMSDIGRLLGMLILLSSGITLTLWGLNRRRHGVVVMALFLCLAALVPTVLAIELPPMGSVAQIQTSGPNTELWVGDWYTSRNPDAGGPGYHAFDIYVPCTPLPGLTVELYDPESYYTTIGGAPYADLDEIRPDPGVPVPDNTTFTLTNPSGVVIAATTYIPTGGTSQSWVIFDTFDPGIEGCGIYRLTATTSDDDDNAWRLRVTPDDPDGTPGTGDEISLGNLQTSFQHETFGCQTFHFFVPVTPSVRLSNFDMDVPGYCTPPTCTIAYTTPSGVVIDGTESGGTEWSGGGTAYPPPADVIANPESGWWQAELCLNDDNQYIFDTGGLAYFYDKPPVPDMTVSKDDGTASFNPDGVLNYTITYNNAGPGAALDAVLTDTLPISTTYLSCGGGLSCGYAPPPPGSGVVTFSLGTIISMTSGSVTVSVRVDPGAPTGTITNIVELDYSDIIFSDYDVITDTDVDQYEEPPAPTPEPPTPTPTPTPTPVPPTPEPPEPEPPLPTFTPTFTPTPIPIPPASVTPTPTVEVLAVAMLPETGGLPGWFTIALGVPIIIGAASLLNLALLEMRGRRGDRKGD